MVFNRKHTEEERENLRKKMLGNKCALGKIAWNKGLPKEKQPHYGHKMSDETKKKISSKKKGKPTWNKGKHLSEEWKRKIGLKISQRKHSEITKRKISKARKGRKATKETKMKMSLLFRKEKNPNWQNGKTKLNTCLRESFSYRQWRSDIFERDNYTCQNCQKKGGKLEAHHLKRFSLILKENNVMTLEEGLNCAELWNINNGQTLCVRCHKIKHRNKLKICDIKYE